MVKLVVFLLTVVLVTVLVVAVTTSEKDKSLEKFCQCWLNRQRRNINTK